MAKFYVGQRVRIVACRNRAMKALVGKEGVIVSRCNVNPGGWDVDIPGHGVCAPNGLLCSWDEDHLEPIAKPGQETVDWSKSLCRPDGSYNPAGDHIPTMAPEWVSAWGGR